MSRLDQIMIAKLPEGTAIRVEVARRGESLTLRADLVRRLTHNGQPAESSQTVHEETGPERQVVANYYRWLGENMAELNTKRSTP